MFKRRPKHASIALSLKLVTMLLALIHKLGINVTAIRTMCPCAIQARHVVFGRACGAALTTPNILRKATAYDIAIMLPEQPSASTASRTTKPRAKQAVEEQTNQKGESGPV